ncbi:hypothetical protein DY000_02039177 [Brassica cretica]|uniref:Uncharacterized protein n=1 Tax=Brassica cretica TaxID=69181 RepID=A0ABQ7B5D4_BRACR|nr:hypothetical protein DY000_02039177 [Brassica cretica]
MAVSTWPDFSHLCISKPELVSVLRQMGQQVKWPQKMKAPDSFRNPGLWCDFHRDHGHKTEDCVTLRIEVNKLLKERHLWEFLSKKAKSHLNKETSGKPTEAVPGSPPRQDRVIHVISGGSEISGISHTAAKKSTWNAKHSLEAAKPKRLLLGTDEISFTTKEQEKTTGAPAISSSKPHISCLGTGGDMYKEFTKCRYGDETIRQNLPKTEDNSSVNSATTSENYFRSLLPPGDLLKRKPLSRFKTRSRPKANLENGANETMSCQGEPAEIGPWAGHRLPSLPPDSSSIQTRFSSATWPTYLAESPCLKPPKQPHGPSKRPLPSHTSQTFPCAIMETSCGLLCTLFRPSRRECHSVAVSREGVCADRPWILPIISHGL